jgi:mannose-6-phosphate isomerase-like protein (cupin superfamily)
MNMLEFEKITNEGLIEAYCMGTLTDAEAEKISILATKYPEVQLEIDKTIATLISIKSNQLDPSLKNKILNRIEGLIEPTIIDIHNPSPINKYSEAVAWRNSITQINKPVIEDGVGVHTIIDRSDFQLSIVWLYESLTEEGHDHNDFKESFLILEGSCECDFDGKIYQFTAGDFFDIPNNINHTIKNISTTTPYVKGIVQRRKIAV